MTPFWGLKPKKEKERAMIVQGIDGASVKLSDKDGSIDVGENGYLGKLVEGTLFLTINVEPGAQIIGFTTDGQGKLHLLDERMQVRIPIERGARQIRGLPGKEKDVFFTKSPANNIRLAELRGGRLRTHQISIITQWGHFYLVQECTWNVPLYNQGGVITSPLTWDELHGVINDPKVQPWVKAEDLPPCPAELSAQVTEPTISLAQGQYQVLWYSLATGVGCLIDSSGQQVRVHWTQVPLRENGIRYLVAGEIVNVGFTVDVGDKSAFKKEAKRVTLVCQDRVREPKGDVARKKEKKPQPRSSAPRQHPSLEALQALVAHFSGGNARP